MTQLLNSIAEKRKGRGLTRKDLAKQMQVAPITLWRIETGRRPATDKYLYQIATILDLEPADLLRSDPVPCPVKRKRTRGKEVPP